MADWLNEVVRILLKTAEEDPELAKEILFAVKRIERSPLSFARPVSDTRYVYFDEKGRFRISFNYEPDGSMEIVVLNITS